MDDRFEGQRTVDVFVYGTLMRHGLNHHLMGTAEFLDTARTAPGYVLYNMGWFPAMRGGGVETVVGELYRVLVTDLQTLDRYEGCPDLYERLRIQLSDGAEAYAYLLKDEFPDDAQRIATGDWHRRLEGLADSPREA